MMTVRIGEDLRAARLTTRLSLSLVGAEVQMSRSKVGRIERGQARRVALVDLCAVAAAVGLDVSVKLYPGPRPGRDAGHVRLLARLQHRIDSRFRWLTEVPLPVAGDERAWDAVIVGDGFRLAVEAETRLGDLQALERRIRLKSRDSRLEPVVLLVADTRHNRDALGAAGGTALSSFPLSGRAVLAALASGCNPGGSGIVLL